MAQGKATKATKAKKTKTTGGTKAAAASTETKKAAGAVAPEAPGSKAAGAPAVTAPTEPAAGTSSNKTAPAAAPGGTVPSPGAVIPRKKNVKRGAPPMLPRRLVRRPESAGSAVSPPPRPMPPTGSVQAPARAPEGAELLKQRLSTVMSLLAQLRELKRTLNRQFYEAGLVLQKLSDPELYKAKGYGSFESFVEREIERELSIGRSLVHDLVQIVRVFQRGPAEELGLERLRAALKVLWPEPGVPTAAAPTSGTAG